MLPGALSREPTRARETEVEDGFRIIDNGKLDDPARGAPSRGPHPHAPRLPRSHNHQVRLSRMAQRLLRENLDLIDETVQATPESSDLFMQHPRERDRVSCARSCR